METESRGLQRGFSGLLENPLSPRLLKKVQMQGGKRWVERGVLQVRRSEHPSAPTQQMGLFQQPARSDVRIFNQSRSGGSGSPSGMNSTANPLLHQRWPVGAGPSGKTCP